MGKPYVSVVVPLFNEEGNVTILHQEIVEACRKLGKKFEIIFVDDGSNDNTVRKCRKLKPLKLV